MTEVEKMICAKQYIDNLARGIDPTTNETVKEDDVINNVHVTRCLYYVSDVLKIIIDNGGAVVPVKSRSNDKLAFLLSKEQIESLVPENRELSASKIASAINSLIDKDNMHVLTVTSITKWLLQAGLLYESIDELNGKKRKVPTEMGIRIGLKETTFFDGIADRRYVVYNSQAQQFIFDNIEPITEMCNREYAEKAALKQLKHNNKGEPWTEEDDALLKQMYHNGSSFKELSDYFGRTTGAIKSRLKKFDLLD